MHRATAARETMEGQPAELRRILEDREPVERVAGRLEAERVFVVGTGTSFHAANQGAYLLRLAGLEAWAVQAADAAVGGPRPRAGDSLVLLSHRGTKRFTSEVLAAAREDGVSTVAIGGIGAPGADVETTPQERAGTFTASHLGALARLAQLAEALGAELPELERVPDAVAEALAARWIGLDPPERGLEFIGVGPNQWTAAEGALKVREASHVFAQGGAAEQFLHGHAFALGPQDTLVALDGGGPAAPRLRDVADAVESQGTRVYRLEERALGEPLSIFPLTAWVQRIALELSDRLDVDPDDVRPAGWTIEL